MKTKRTTKTAEKAQEAAKDLGAVSRALTAERDALATAKGRKPLPVTPLARSIRNAYKNAAKGRQEAEILRRIEEALPAPTAQEIGRALAASGIPAHRAGKVAMDWGAISGPAGNRAVELIRQFNKDTAADALLIQSLGALERAHPEHDWRADSGALRRQLLKYMDENKVYDLEAAFSKMLAADLPKTAAECPAYLKRVFDLADPEHIAADTGTALDRVLTICAPNRFSSEMIDILESAGIPKPWHTKIRLAARDTASAREEAERKAEVSRRKAEGAEAPQPEAEAPKAPTIGEALKALVDSGHGVSMNGKIVSLRGLPLWQREGVLIQPREIQALRAQIAVMIGLVDGVTTNLLERDPEEREARKLSALREQADNLFGLLDPILTGEGGADL